MAITPIPAIKRTLFEKFSSHRPYEAAAKKCRPGARQATATHHEVPPLCRGLFSSTDWAPLTVPVMTNWEANPDSGSREGDGYQSAARPPHRVHPFCHERMMARRIRPGSGQGTRHCGRLSAGQILLLACQRPAPRYLRTLTGKPVTLGRI